MLLQAKSTVRSERLPAAHCYLTCMATDALMERDTTFTLGYKVVAFFRIKDAHSFVDRVTVEVAAVEASPARSLPNGERRRMKIDVNLLVSC